MSSQTPKFPTAHRCVKCGRISYPKHERCPHCKGRRFEELEIRREGILLTYTRVYMPHAGVEKSPLSLGIVDFGEGIRILGQILVDNPRPGMKLRPTWGPLRKIEDKQYDGFRFQPSEETN